MCSYNNITPDAREVHDLSKKFRVWFLEAPVSELTGTTDPQVNAAFQYFAHYIYQSTKDNCNLKDTGFAKCPSDNFRRMFGLAIWNKVRPMLIDKLVDCDNHCVPAVFNGTGTSYGYRLKPHLRGERWRKQYLVKAPKIEYKLVTEITRIQKTRAKYMTKTHKTLEKMQNQLAFHNLPQVETLKPKKKRLKKGKQVITLGEWQQLLQSKVDEINNGEFRYTVPTGGRAYQSLTGLDTQAREYLRANGKQIVELDVKQCHLTILKFVLDKFYNQYVLSQYSHMGIESHLSAEFERVYAIKDWYLFLVENIPSIKSRGAAKTAWQNFMYDIDHPNRPLAEFMASRFQNIYKAIVFMKGRDSAKFACLLQQTEGEIIFEGARLALAGGISYVGSVHDSLTTVVGSEDLLETCLVEAFSKVGINHVRLEKNYWN